MNYPDTINYLYSQLPLFTRDGASAYKADLTNTIALLNNLGNPQHRFKSVHVGGTNGKGSTSHMLAAVLQTAGYKTGLYTSPHLKDFRERIRINGRMISEQQVIDFVSAQRSNFDVIRPSFFEMTVALAFENFAREKVDIAIIEVGLGGRLDSTNVITPLVSVITNIGWDHTNILGNTLRLIAGEKAGIIKPGVPVIIGEYQPEIAEVFINKAAEGNSPVRFASEEWSVVGPEVRGRKSEVESQLSQAEKDKEKPQFGESKIDGLLEIKVTRIQDETSSNLHPELRTPDFGLQTSDFTLDLTGTYQLKNIKAVLSAVDELRQQGFVITDEHLKTALRQVKTLTGLHGRWEILNKHPLTICDTGHNPEGMQEVLQNIANVPYNKLHFVFGVVNDKDISKILAMLPTAAMYYFCKPDIPRGLDAESLRVEAAKFNLRGEIYPSVKQALAAAQQNAGENDLVFVGGSTFVVAEIA
ncbi:MAG: bifunctional folylpolyglutamate synthase/dihydrofolate synthase [Mucilaginibacter sp.]